MYLTDYNYFAQTLNSKNCHATIDSNRIRKRTFSRFPEYFII